MAPFFFSGDSMTGATYVAELSVVSHKIAMDVGLNRFSCGYLALDSFVLKHVPRMLLNHHCCSSSPDLRFFLILIVTFVVHIVIDITFHVMIIISIMVGILNM
jgi:hypothetical protein